MIFLKRQKVIIKPKKPYKYFKFYTRQLRDIAFLKKNISTYRRPVYDFIIHLDADSLCEEDQTGLA